MIKLVFLLAVVSVTLAEVTFEECRDSQGNPKKPGDTWYEQDCKVLTCGLSPSGEIYVESTGCPQPTVQAPCELSRKPYENWPNCCPFIKCTTSSNNDPYIWNKYGHGRK